MMKRSFHNTCLEYLEADCESFLAPWSAPPDPNTLISEEREVSYYDEKLTYAALYLWLVRGSDYRNSAHFEKVMEKAWSRYHNLLLIDRAEVKTLAKQTPTKHIRYWRITDEAINHTTSVLLFGISEWVG